MRAFLKYLARGVLLCAGLLVLSLSVCLAAGLFWIPEAGESDAEIPKVYVIEPKEEEQAGGETQTAENTAEQGTESPAAGKTEGGEGTAASAGADAGADSRTDSGAGPVKMLFAGDLFLHGSASDEIQPAGNFSRGFRRASFCAPGSGYFHAEPGISFRNDRRSHGGKGIHFSGGPGLYFRAFGSERGYCDACQ